MTGKQPKLIAFKGKNIRRIWHNDCKEYETDCADTEGIFR
jgi:hypothetical protein